MKKKDFCSYSTVLWCDCPRSPCLSLDGIEISGHLFKNTCGILIQRQLIFCYDCKACNSFALSKSVLKLKRLAASLLHLSLGRFVCVFIDKGDARRKRKRERKYECVCVTERYQHKAAAPSAA